ncbi:MAG: hypothetical protein JWR32_4187 [Mycobacterium sp.]|jgi:hypothetical protein|nr:hypothetical protein [Mycobacterium sp.]
MTPKGPHRCLDRDQPDADTRLVHLVHGGPGRPGGCYSVADIAPGVRCRSRGTVIRRPATWPIPPERFETVPETGAEESGIGAGSRPG